MFTGIIEECGTLKAKGSGSLTIAASKVLENTAIGDSIAVNGVCLTVTGFTNEGFTCDVMPQTLRVSGLSMVSAGDEVNLERAMAAGGRFGGHIVSGHIDGIGTVKSVKNEGNAVWVEIEPEGDLMSGVIEKGSVAIDGVSLTVAKRSGATFSVSLIPHTREETNMKQWIPGRMVNLETDVIGKYVRHYMEPKKESNITMDFLYEHGFA